MKKKIAVCGNGWSNEYLKIVLSGIRRGAAENNADVFLLMNYAIDVCEEFKSIGDANTFRVIDYVDFDGIILLSNTFHQQEEIDYLSKKIVESNIPAVSLEYQLPNIDFMGSDNYSGMYELCSHLVEEHGVKEVIYISGPKDNLESNTRKEALQDVLEKQGLSLKEENVICCNWNYHEVHRKLPVWLENHTNLPDAVICANDVMAMAACVVLKERGISIPEEVKVTGFDHLSSARVFFPAIASVDRNWDDMGYQSVKYLLDKIERGVSIPANYVKSKAAPDQSCGCEVQEMHTHIKKNVKSGEYGMYVDTTFWGGHLCDISECLMKVSSDEDFHSSFGKYLESEHEHEGDELYICLVENFFSSLAGGEPLQHRGYTPKMDIICGLKDGRALERVTIDTKHLIPGYDANSEAGRVYVLLSLYSMEGCYGYVVFGNERKMMYDYSLANWMRNLIMSFKYVRQNIMMIELNDRLSKLSVTDGLTGVYNRMGCEEVAYPYLKKCHEQGRRAVLMFADINKMKVINDKYGHLQGDIAICTVANAIKEVLKDKWIIVRYGGDEFLMVGECEDGEEPQRLLMDIEEHLKETAAQMNLPYKLRAGVGFVLVEPTENLDLSECLKKADEAMYAMKKKQHSEIQN